MMDLINNYKLLGTNVVVQAINDYKRACRTGNMHEIKHLESFFLGDDFAIFTDLDGKKLLYSLKNRLHN